jgi:hypothetical protein
MLSINRYDQAYVGQARARIASQLSTYATLLAAMKGQAPGDGDAQDAVIAAFEHDFFAHLVLALDHYFDHRARGLEGDGGNPLNEVRLLCDALMRHDGRLTLDAEIRYDPARSILKLAPGDPIRMGADDFDKLQKAFFAEIETRYA